MNGLVPSNTFSLWMSYMGIYLASVEVNLVVHCISKLMCIHYSLCVSAPWIVLTTVATFTNSTVQYYSWSQVIMHSSAQLLRNKWVLVSVLGGKKTVAVSHCRAVESQWAACANFSIKIGH